MSFFVEIFIQVFANIFSKLIFSRLYDKCTKLERLNNSTEMKRAHCEILKCRFFKHADLKEKLLQGRRYNLLVLLLYALVNILTIYIKLVRILYLKYENLNVFIIPSKNSIN